MTLHAYFERHAQTLLGALGRIARQPFATLMIIGVIGIALALPLILNSLIQNARQASGNWTEGIDLTLYLNTGVGEERARAIATQLRSRTDIAAVQVITAQQALAEFREHAGFGAALDTLTDNPLPNLLVITPTLEASRSDAAQSLQAQLAGIADVADVQVDTAWVKRFHAMLDAARRLVAAISGLLVAGIVLIIGNTVRLDILNRRNEIEVMKLVGGSDGFARRPFLYSGFLYGLGGGAMALLLAALTTRMLAGAIRHLAETYGSDFGLTGVGWMLSAQVLLGAGLLGWLGAWVAATWHIRAIEPS